MQRCLAFAPNGKFLIAALHLLAEVVEPVKDYTRMNSLKTVWDFRGSLNRLVDIARPESAQARRLRDAVQTYIGSGYKDQAAEAEIRTRLAAWRDNDARLHPLLEQSFLDKCSLPRPLRERRPGTQGAARQGVVCCVALFAAVDVCVSRASQRSTFCFFSAPGTAR